MTLVKQAILAVMFRIALFLEGWHVDKPIGSHIWPVGCLFCMVCFSTGPMRESSAKSPLQKF